MGAKMMKKIAKSRGIVGMTDTYSITAVHRRLPHVRFSSLP